MILQIQVNSKLPPEQRIDKTDIEGYAYLFHDWIFG